MSHIKFDYSKVLDKFVAPHELDYMQPQVTAADSALRNGTGPGAEMTGWLNLPEEYDKDEFARIQKAAAKIQSDSEVLIVIGIGGSYLGARAAIDFLNNSFVNLQSKEERKAPQILYAGNSISSSYLADLVDYVSDKDFSVRNILYRKGYLTEVLANYEPSLQYFSEWWKQLAGESEGKDQKGIYPTSANFSTDLHSLGQFIQEGTRILFETVVRVDKPRKNVLIPELAEDLDGLGYLQGKDVDFVNKKATDGVLLAHTDGGVPNMFVTLPEQDEFTLGYTIYFFELAIALSGYLNGINPFDQPGVEAYKKNMFALLGKPGFEELGAELNARL